MFPMRASVHTLSFSEDYSTVLANSDRRIYLLDSRTLKELCRWNSRVPHGMFSLIQMDEEIAMKSRVGKNISMYDLNTMKTRRIDVGFGLPLFRDIKAATFLSACQMDGTVRRVNPKTGEIGTLFSGSPFDACGVDYGSQTMWLSEGIAGNYEYICKRAEPKVDNRMHLFSLKDPADLRRFDAKYKFDAVGVSSGAKYLWVQRTIEEGHCECDWTTNLSILSISQGLKEVERFKPLKGEAISHADAAAGLVFTHHRLDDFDRDKVRYLIRCWKV
jgi:hypothetical protein